MLLFLFSLSFRKEERTSLSKRKSISVITPSGTYGSFDEAYKEARALKEYLDYHLKKHTNFYIKIGVSDINPRHAEYRSIACGRGHPPKDLIFKDDKNPYTRPHLHILIQESEHADIIANKIMDYLSARHSSIKNDDYKLHPDKRYISDVDLKRTIGYIEAQSRNAFTCKPKIAKTKKDNALNVNECEAKSADFNQKKSITTYTLTKEQNELLINLRFSYLLAKFLFRLSKIFNDLYAHELIYIKNQLCTAADYTKRNMLTYAYNVLDFTTGNLTLLREKLRQLLHYSSIENKESIELESENIYKAILEKLEKSELS